VKCLPRQDGESAMTPAGNVTGESRWRKEKSRRHRGQIMVALAVANPKQDPDRKFDGKILFERIAMQKKAKKSSSNQGIVDEQAKNQCIISTWRTHVSRTDTGKQMIAKVAKVFDLPDKTKKKLFLFGRQSDKRRKSRKTHERTFRYVRATAVCRVCCV